MKGYLIVPLLLLMGCSHTIELQPNSPQRDFDRANAQIREVLGNPETKQVFHEIGDSILTSEVWVGYPGTQVKVSRLSLRRDSTWYAVSNGESMTVPTFSLGMVSLNYPVWGSTTSMGIGTVAGAIVGYSLISWLTTDSLNERGPHNGKEWKAAGISALVCGGIGFLSGLILGKHDGGHDIVLQAKALAAHPTIIDYPFSTDRLSAGSSFHRALRWREAASRTIDSSTLPLHSGE